MSVNGKDKADIFDEYFDTKPIIIDGCNVAECMYFDNAMCQAEKRADGNTITECFGFTCYFKQLQRLKIKLKAIREVLNE